MSRRPHRRREALHRRRRAIDPADPGAALLLARKNWNSLGVDPTLHPPYAVAATAALGVLVWNGTGGGWRSAQTWDEMLVERWRGKIGEWVRAATLGTLAKVYGERRMRDYTRKLIELKAMNLTVHLPARAAGRRRRRWISRWASRRRDR